VSALFDGIVDIAAKNDTLVLVLLDEVESIVSSRKASAAGGDHRDGVRVKLRLPAVIQQQADMIRLQTRCSRV